MASGGTDKRPIWLSVSESAKFMGVESKTIRRAIKHAGALKYKIVQDRYQIEFASLLDFTMSKVKLRHKFEESGLGQYREKIKEHIFSPENEENE
jgi:hypothetical protein